MKYVLKKYGDIPVVLSVPHGGMEEPEGFMIRRSGNRRVDMFTLDPALELEVSLKAAWGRPYLAAGLLRRCIIDYNRPPEEAFEDPAADRHYRDFHQGLWECIAHARQKHGACLLLDIHGRVGRGPGQPPVVLGTGNFAGMGPEKTRDICAFIRDQGWEARHDTTGPYRGGYIVRRYADSRSVYGLQLEINREVRENEDLRRSFSSSLAGALAAFGHLHFGGGKTGCP